MEDTQPTPSTPPEQPKEPQGDKKKEENKPAGLPPEVLANLPPEVQKQIKEAQNKAAKAPENPAGKEDGKAGKKPEDAKKKKKKKFPVVGCLVVFIVLYLLSIILGILILWLNKDNTAFLGNFGLINDVELKEFILSAIQVAFVPLALLFLILTIIGVFILSTAKKDQPDKRKKGISMTLVNLIILIILIPVWIGIYNFVFALPVAGERTLKAEIITTPANTQELVAPVSIDFSVENIQKVLSRKNLIMTNIAWNFDGDETFEAETNEMTVTREFTSKGSFPVSVRVLTNDGKENIYSKMIIIPDAIFAADPDSGPAPLEVTFDATAVTSGENIDEYRWDFNDDTKFDETTVGPTATFTFEQLGTYTIRLQTIDKNGLEKNYKRDIEVLKGAEAEIQAVIKASPGTEGEIPFQVQLNASDSESTYGKIIRYEWDFGDGSPIKSGEKQTYVYKKAGTYQLELVVEDENDNKASEIIEIVAKTKPFGPEAIIKTKPAYNENSAAIVGSVPFSLEFDASKSTDKDKNITEYSWDFDGDEEFDEFGDKVTHVYREPGSYVVTLNVKDADDQESSTQITVNVREAETKAIITCREPETCSGPIPLTVEFDATQSTTTDGSDIVNYEWDFGDGSGVIPTGAITSHLYSKVGTYNVKLKIYSSSGLTEQTTKTVFARVVPLQSCFEASRTSGQAPLTVKFDSNCSTGTIKNWKWSFGDGFTSDDRKPNHTFKKAGNYTVLLEITDAKNNVSKYSMAIAVE